MNIRNDAIIWVGQVERNKFIHSKAIKNHCQPNKKAIGFKSPKKG